MDQFSFDLGFVDAQIARARSIDPWTSHAAARAAKDVQAAHQALILQALKRGPAGVDKLATMTRLQAHAIGKRMCELERAGAITLTGETVQSTSGRQQREWRLV